MGETVRIYNYDTFCTILGDGMPGGAMAAMIIGIIAGIVIIVFVAFFVMWVYCKSPVAGWTRVCGLTRGHWWYKLMFAYAEQLYKTY